MPRIAVPAVTIRTTSDGKGHPHGIATGMGLSPELALSALKKEARTQAENVAAGHSPPGFQHSSASASPPLSAFPPLSASEVSAGGRREALDKPREWRFEVVDVRLAPALMEGGESGWLAYGTLLSEHEQPPR